MELSKQAYMTLILVIAVYMDFKCYRINNKLIVIGTCIGSLHNFVNQGIYGLTCSLLGGIVPIGLLFFFYLSSVLGAGDIKLFAVIGTFGGISFCIKSMLIAFIIGAIISLIKMVRYRIVITRLQYFTEHIFRLIHEKKLLSYYNVEEKKEECIIHFSLPICLATIILCILDYI